MAENSKMEPLIMIEIDNLRKTFHGHPAPAIKDINLRIAASEFVVILGSNGSGKSTLLKCISGKYQPDTGHIRLGSRDITHMKVHKRAQYISFVSQDTRAGTAADMTVLENMCLSGSRGLPASLGFYSKKRAQMRKKIMDLNIGLEEAIDKKMSLLSGGQRQTIATLMAFEPQPQLLLLDEHTSALDPKSRMVLMEYTSKYVLQNKITTMMITHNVDDAIKYGNRLIIMQHGDIVFDADASEKITLKYEDIINILHANEDYGTEDHIAKAL